jgi:hypothetical protein
LNPLQDRQEEVAKEVVVDNKDRKENKMGRVESYCSFGIDIFASETLYARKKDEKENVEILVQEDKEEK